MEKIKQTLDGQMDFLKSFFDKYFLPLLQKIFETTSLIRPKHILLFGFILFLTGFVKQEFFVSGIVIVFGSLAYISARKRNGIFTKELLLRNAIELFYFIILFGVIFLQKDIKINFILNPLTNIILPSLALSFYLFPTLENKFGDDKRTSLFKIALIIVLILLSFFAGYIASPRQSLNNNVVDNNNESAVTPVSFEEWKTFNTDPDFSISLPSEPNKEEKNYKISLDSSLTYDQYLYVAQTEKVIFSAEKLTFPPKSNFSDPTATLKALVGVTLKKIEGANLDKADIVSVDKNPAVDFLITKNGMSVRGRAVFKNGEVYRATAFYDSKDLSDDDYKKFVDSLEIK